MIFLTGVSGYVGRRVARRLTASGLRVRGLVPAGEDLPADLPGVELVRGDILDPASLEPLGSGVTAVVHAAAAMLPNPPEKIRSVNVDGTHHVLAAARRWGATQFVYVSAVSAAYAKKNSYGQSKVDAEALVAASGIPFAVLRPTMVYGEGGGLARGEDLAVFLPHARGAPRLEPGRGPRLPAVRRDLRLPAEDAR